jgi:hypothetical protein
MKEKILLARRLGLRSVVVASGNRSEVSLLGEQLREGALYVRERLQRVCTFTRAASPASWRPDVELYKFKGTMKRTVNCTSANVLLLRDWRSLEYRPRRWSRR